VGGETRGPGGCGDEGADEKGGEVVGKRGTARDKGSEEEGGDGLTEEVLEGAGVREIMDSEDDDDDDDLAATQRPPKLDHQPPKNEHKAPAPPPPASPLATNPTTEIILVDNLTTLINTLFSHTSTPAAHALLAQLSRTLTTLTRNDDEQRATGETETELGVWGYDGEPEFGNGV
ncbi:hypothetical protein V498_10028, partial [Pseudogymnoascus sp. VKM F-4517 (FW-2822)]